MSSSEEDEDDVLDAFDDIDDDEKDKDFKVDGKVSDESSDDEEGDEEESLPGHILPHFRNLIKSSIVGSSAEPYVWSCERDRKWLRNS